MSLFSALRRLERRRLSRIPAGQEKGEGGHLNMKQFYSKNGMPENEGKMENKEQPQNVEKPE